MISAPRRGVVGASFSCMASRPLIDVEMFAAMAPDERLAATVDAVVTEPAEMSPAMTRMVEVGWVEQDIARRISSEG